MTCDPFWTDVSLLLEMGGANGSTTFVDSSTNNFTVTPVGATTPTITTALALFSGTGSAHMPPWNSVGAAPGLEVPITGGGPLDLLNNNTDFTVEGWFYLPTGTVFTCPIFDIGNNGSFSSSTNVYLQVTNGNGGAGSVECISDVSAWGTLSPSTPPVVPLNTWKHVAVTREGGNAKLWYDGNFLADSGSNPWTAAGYPGYPSGATVRAGGSSATSNNNEINGYSLYDFRITKGIARYTGNSTYTIPTASFPTTQCGVPVTVPDIVGLSQSAADGAIVGAGLTVGTITVVLNPLTPGTVLTQAPAAGSSAMTGDPVDFSVSTGVAVPNIVNTSVAVVAPGLLAAASLILGAVTFQASGTVIAGNVISQSPAAGTTVSGGSAVNVVVSTGLPSLTVPDLFGLTQTDAVNLLLSLGLGVGAIGSAPSKFVSPGEVQAQNPSPGAPVAVGTIVSFVLSQGTPVAGTLFDFEQTVISQYANSPTILQLCTNLNQYIDQSANFANFYNFVWNVDTAVGFGLDIWGTIVGVSRLLQIPNSTLYVGFDIASESQPDQDWTPAGSRAAPYNNPPVGGAMYTGANATEAYLLNDDSYRQLILAKAFANICTTTAPAINQILQNLYGAGTAWVLNTGPMAISYNLSFNPTAIQLAILEQSGVIPTPPGVAVTINTNV